MSPPPPNNKMHNMHNMRMYTGKGIPNHPAATDKLTLDFLRFLNADKNVRYSKKKILETMAKLTANQALLLDTGFRLLDRNNNKSISKGELLSGARQLVKAIRTITNPFM